MLRFHAASLAVPPDSAVRSMLENALTTADGILLEGRNRMYRLRSDSLTGVTLTEAPEGLCAELNRDSDAKTAVN